MRELAWCASSQIDSADLRFVRQQLHLLAQGIDITLAQRQGSSGVESTVDGDTYIIEENDEIIDAIEEIYNSEL